MFKRNKRILWLLDHRTLTPYEASLIQRLGFEIHVPKVIPKSNFRSRATKFSEERVRRQFEVARPVRLHAKQGEVTMHRSGRQLRSLSQGAARPVGLAATLLPTAGRIVWSFEFTIGN